MISFIYFVVRKINFLVCLFIPLDFYPLSPYTYTVVRRELCPGLIVREAVVRGRPVLIATIVIRTFATNVLLIRLR